MPYIPLRLNGVKWTRLILVGFQGSVRWIGRTFWRLRVGEPVRKVTDVAHVSMRLGKLSHRLHLERVR